jgi:hypothetical protein
MADGCVVWSEVGVAGEGLAAVAVGTAVGEVDAVAGDAGLGPGVGLGALPEQAITTPHRRIPQPLVAATSLRQLLFR